MMGMGGPGGRGGSINANNAISGEKKKSAMFKLMKLLAPQWYIVAFCCVLGIILNLANLLKPYIMEIAVDDFITVYAGLGMDKVNELTRGANWFTGTLWGLGITYFLVIVFGQFAGYAQTMLMTRVCQKLLHNLRMKAFYHIHHMKLHDLDEMGSGRLLTRSTNDIEALDEFYGDILLGLFKDIFLLIGIVIGTLIAVVRVMPKYKLLPRILDKICVCYIELFRGTPMVVQLLIGY